jgi:hypothetical protein
VCLLPGPAVRGASPRSSWLHGPKRCRYSLELMKALTISAAMKSPLN